MQRRQRLTGWNAWERNRELARRDDAPSAADEGFGLIEVIVALTILLLISAAVGWVIVSSVGADVLSKQRSAASSLIEQRDAYVQAAAPTTGCSTAPTTFAATSTQALANGSGVATTYTITTTTATAVNGLMPVSITVSWTAAFPTRQTATIQNQIQVQCVAGS